jgi:flagellar hook assembly protein FlgD
MKDTDIRITDIAGNLVHKAKSLGGQIIWDGKNLKGSRVSTGVYLIFASDSKGEETHVAKLLFIN